MAEHNELGKTGEELALEYLENKGFNILETNWKFGKLEIDIIALTKKHLVIFEVKTRSTSAFGEPQVFIDRNKQKFLIRAAQHYAEKYRIEQEVRFDIISIIMNTSKIEITHLEDAFYPVL